jgi:hypothetical protein
MFETTNGFQRRIHPSLFIMREVISINIGQAGIQSGNACW